MSARDQISLGLNQTYENSQTFPGPENVRYFKISRTGGNPVLFAICCSIICHIAPVWSYWEDYDIVFKFLYILVM